MSNDKSNINEFEEIMCNSLELIDQKSLIFHLLYASDSYEYDASLESIADNFSRGFGYTINTNDWVFKVTQNIINNKEEIDQKILPLLSNWRFDRLGTVTRLILRLGIWQLANLEQDVAVIINDSIELAKCFAEKDAHKFINGVLDEFAKRNNLKNSIV